MPDPVPDPSAFTDLLARCIDAITTDGPSGADELLAAHPEHADAVRERLRKLQKAGLLGDLPSLDDEIPERLGDFRLVRRLGSGGMGVVYLAVQESLGREVALKLVRPEQLFFPGARDRFRREVEAIARMHDPGIVGIHTVGEEGGVPYFAMERIAGATLAEALRRLEGRDPRSLRGADLWRAVLAIAEPGQQPAEPPELFAGSWPETCVRVLEAMILALVHAHAQGVLHRDLKPSNVMVTPAGRVVLLDFGLAQARGAAKITRSGAQLGSLHYMAPEQVRGQAAAVDERTDVYAAGVVLYELLGLRAPFLGATAEEIARQVLAGVPQRLSRRNAQVSWDVETVCFAAMDADRAQRYPSASALLRDLRNLLAQRPIEARRPNLALRARRFAQRNRTLTSVLALLLLAVFVFPIVVAVRESALNRELSDTIGERDREMARARQNVEQAAQALNHVLQLVAEEDLDQIPDLRDFSERLLRQMGAHLEILAASNPAEPAARIALAETLVEGANLRWRFRDMPSAEAAFMRAIELLGVVGTRAVDPDRFDYVRLDAGLALALLRSRRGDYAEYVRALRDVLGDADAETGRSRSFRERLATGLERLGQALVYVDADAAPAALARAAAIRQQLAAEFDDAQAWLEVAAGETAAFVLRSSRSAAGRAEVQARADAALRRAAAHEPTDDDQRRALATQLSSRGSQLEDLAMLEQAVRLFERSAALRPSRLGTQISLVGTQESLLRVLLKCGRTADGIEVAVRAIERLRALVVTWPQHVRAWKPLVETETELLRLSFEVPEQWAFASERMRTLAADARAMSAIEPQIGTALDAATVAFVLLARCTARGGDLPGAVELAEAARASDERARAIAKTQGIGIGDNLALCTLRAEVLLATGDKAGALAALRAVNVRLPQDLRTRVHGLDAVAAEPGFVEVLQQAEGR